VAAVEVENLPFEHSLQINDPVSSAYDPPVQSSQWVASINSANFPRKQSLHTVKPIEFENVPRSQGSQETAPKSAFALPFSQPAQSDVDFPTSSENFPCPQSVHAWGPAVVLNLPASHASQA